MTPAENAAIRQMFTDVIATHTAEIHGELALIKQEVGFIKVQTTKTNGKVAEQEKKINDLQKADIEHMVNCPLESRLKPLEEDAISQRAMKNLVFKTAGAVGVVATIIIALFELIFKN